MLLGGIRYLLPVIELAREKHLCFVDLIKKDVKQGFEK